MVMNSCSLNLQSETGNPPEGWESEGQITNHTETGPEDQVFDFE